MGENAISLNAMQAQVMQGLLLARNFGDVAALTSSKTGRPDGIVGAGTLQAIEQARVTLKTGGEPGTVDSNLVSALLASPV